MSTSAERFKAFIERLKEFKELILIFVFFASGALWTINYFATREQLENYKCINDLTLSMLVNTKSAEYLTQVVRAARKDLRGTEELLSNTPKNTVTYRSIAEQVDDLKLNLEKLQKSQTDAENVKETALKKLQSIQLGTVKSCS